MDSARWETHCTFTPHSSLSFPLTTKPSTQKFLSLLNRQPQVTYATPIFQPFNSLTGSVKVLNCAQITSIRQGEQWATSDLTNYHPLKSTSLDTKPWEWSHKGFFIDGITNGFHIIASRRVSRNRRKSQAIPHLPDFSWRAEFLNVFNDIPFLVQIELVTRRSFPPMLALQVGGGSLKAGFHQWRSRSSKSAYHLVKIKHQS